MNFVLDERASSAKKGASSTLTQWAVTSSGSSGYIARFGKDERWRHRIQNAEVRLHFV